MESEEVLQWMRKQLFKKPKNTSLKSFQTAFEKSGLAQKLRPKESDMEALQASVKERWGVDIDKLPLHNGSLNTSAMVRLYIDKFGSDVGEAKARPYFEEDGVRLSQNQFATTKSVYLNPKSKEKKSRVIPTSKKQRAQLVVASNARTRKTPEGRDLKTIEQIETMLENLIQMASELSDRKIFDDLRNARRRASAALLSR